MFQFFLVTLFILPFPPKTIQRPNPTLEMFREMQVSMVIYVHIRCMQIVRKSQALMYNQIYNRFHLTILSPQPRVSASRKPQS